MILIAKRTNTRSFAAAAFVATALLSVFPCVHVDARNVRVPLATYSSQTQVCVETHTPRPTGEERSRASTTKGRPTVSVGCKVSLLPVFSPRGRRLDLENGDADPVCIVAVFYLSGTQGVERKGEEEGDGRRDDARTRLECVSSHYILSHCMDDVAILAGPGPLTCRCTRAAAFKLLPCAKSPSMKIYNRTALRRALFRTNDILSSPLFLRPVFFFGCQV